MEIVPLTGGLGAEIFGADLRDDSQFAAIKAAFITHSVITIRAQTLDPDDLLRFGRRWGDINVNRFFAALDTHPKIDCLERSGSDWRDRRAMAHRSCL